MDARGEVACSCSRCGGFVHKSLVSPPCKQCKLCLAKRQERGDCAGGAARASDDVLASIPRPPEGSLVQVKERLPRGVTLSWLPPDVVLGEVRDGKVRCRVEGCRAMVNDGTYVPHETNVCPSHRECVVWAIRPTGCEPEAYCQGCKGWRPKDPWGYVHKKGGGTRRGKRCETCQATLVAQRAAKTSTVVSARGATGGRPDALVDASACAGSSAPGGVVIDRIDRKSPRDVVPWNGDLLAADGLVWFQQAAKHHPSPEEAASAGAVRVGAKRSRQAAVTAKPLCRVAGCTEEESAVRGMCIGHRDKVVHEQVALGECAQQRHCPSCKVKNSAFEFTWDGRCRKGCVARGAGGLKGVNTDHAWLKRVRGVVVGVAWPEHLGAPDAATCRAGATHLNVGLLHDIADGLCRYESLVDGRCTVGCEAGHLVCSDHVGIAAVSVGSGGLVWTCPQCLLVKGLEARGAGICRACYASNALHFNPSPVPERDFGGGATRVATAGGDLAVGLPRSGPSGSGQTVSVDGVHVAWGTPEVGHETDDDSMFDFGIDGMAAVGERAAGERGLEIGFRVGGSKPPRPAPQLPEGKLCNSDGCGKKLSEYDGLGGQCIVCMVMRAWYASPVDLLALLEVPGALYGGQGTSCKSPREVLFCCEPTFTLFALALYLNPPDVVAGLKNCTLVIAIWSNEGGVLVVYG